MTQASIAELVESWWPRYLKANREEKTFILNEFVALTGYHRKPAIRFLRNGRKPKHLDRRGRPRIYTHNVKAALLAVAVWEACGCICSKPQIVSVSIKKASPRSGRERPCAGQRGHHRPPPPYPPYFAEEEAEHPQAWNSSQKEDSCLNLRGVGRRPPRILGGGPRGPLRGESARGEYLHTLCTVDVDTRWYELEVLPNRSQQAVKEGVDRIRSRLPFPLLGIDSDNNKCFHQR